MPSDFMAAVTIHSGFGAQEIKVCHCFHFFLICLPWSDGLDEAQAEIKTVKRNINNLRYADDTTLMAESEEKLKNHLMKVKEESEKTG